MSRARSGYVVEHCGLVFKVPPPDGQEDTRLVYLGDDEDGVSLEVIAVELTDGGRHVIH